MQKIVNFLEHHVLPVIVILAMILGGIALKMYFNSVDKRTREILNKTELTYVTKENELNNNGLYVAELKKELIDFIGKRNISTATYEFEGENFYVDVSIEGTEGDENVSFTIDKIMCPEFGINARIDIEGVESIEYRTGNPTKSSVLKINKSDGHEYLAMTKDTYYFLGDDIESISFIDNHFYYVSHNPKYRLIGEENSCSNEVISEISKFNMFDYYYKYGKINFLPEFYQKLSTKEYTVKDQCDSFEPKDESDEELDDKE